jgi:hypothetical protein
MVLFRVFGIKIHSKKCPFFGSFLWASKEMNEKDMPEIQAPLNDIAVIFRFSDT